MSPITGSITSNTNSSKPLPPLLSTASKVTVCRPTDSAVGVPLTVLLADEKTRPCGRPFILKRIASPLISMNVDEGIVRLNSSSKVAV